MEPGWTPLATMKPRQVGGNLQDTWAVMCLACQHVYGVRGELIYRWLKQRSTLWRASQPKATTTDLAAMDQALVCPECRATSPAIMNMRR